MIFFFAKKYNLTLAAFQSLLQLVRNHWPENNKCATSVYKLKTFFTDKFGGQAAHATFRYCGVCSRKVNEGRSCTETGCTGRGKPPVEFYTGDLTPQLKKRMEGITVICSVPRVQHRSSPLRRNTVFVILVVFVLKLTNGKRFSVYHRVIVARARLLCMRAEYEPHEAIAE